MNITYSGDPEIEKIFAGQEYSGTIYFQVSYHKFENSQGYPSGFFFNDEGALMPFRIYKRFLFEFIQILYPPLKDGKRLEVYEEKKFLEEAIILLKKNGRFHRIMQSFIMEVFNTFPTGAEHCQFGQLFLNIGNATEEQIFSGFQSRYRSQIRSIINENKAVIKYGESELNTCHNLYKDVHQRQGMYFENIDFFYGMNKALAENEVFFYTGYYESIAQCSALVIVKNTEAYYLFGGSLAKTDHPGIIKLMHWEIIKNLKSLGVKKYIWGGCRLSDVEGTKQQGMQEFKLRFGSEIRKGFLWKIDINVTMARLYDLLMLVQAKLKRQNYSKDVIDYEKEREVIV